MSIALMNGSSKSGIGTFTEYVTSILDSLTFTASISVTIVLLLTSKGPPMIVPKIKTIK